MAAVDSFLEADIQQLLEKVAKENGFHDPKFEITSATKPGDNYCGRVSRVLVREKNSPEKRTLTLIMKTAPVSAARRTAFRTSGLFSNEKNMYQTILPAFNLFLKEHGLSEDDIYPATVRCLATKLVGDPSSDELDAIVMEDKSAQGYKMRDRTVGLSESEIRLILKELARLHSASVALRILRPEEARRLEAAIPENIFTRDNPFLHQMVTIAEKSALFTLDRFPVGTPEQTKLRKFLDNYVDFLLFLVQPNPDLTCVVHGDCWVNNILFKSNEEGEADKLCVLDFQFSRVCSPVIDVVSLLFTSTSKKIRDEQYHNFIRFYHDNVSSNLRKFGLEPEEVFSWTTLQEHLKTYGKIGLSLVIFGIQAMVADSSEVPQDIDEIMTTSLDISEVFNGINSKDTDKCKTVLSDILGEMVELGYL